MAYPIRDTAMIQVRIVQFSIFKVNARAMKTKIVKIISPRSQCRYLLRINTVQSQEKQKKDVHGNRIKTRFKGIFRGKMVLRFLCSSPILIFYYLFT